MSRQASIDCKSTTNIHPFGLSGSVLCSFKALCYLHKVSPPQPLTNKTGCPVRHPWLNNTVRRALGKCPVLSSAAPKLSYCCDSTRRPQKSGAGCCVTRNSPLLAFFGSNRFRPRVCFERSRSSNRCAQLRMPRESEEEQRACAIREGRSHPHVPIEKHHFFFSRPDERRGERERELSVLRRETHSRNQEKP